MMVLVVEVLVMLGLLGRVKVVRLLLVEVSRELMWLW